MSKYPTEQELDDSKKFTEFLSKVAFRATNDLRKHLKIDELNFRFAAPFSQNKSKDVYLYRVLDEVQKAGVSIQLWQEYLSDPKGGEKVEEQLERVLFESIIDDQSFRARKLVETLVELICFSQTDEEIYYRDFFLLRDLHESIQAQEDRKEFYAFESSNTNYSIEITSEAIRQLEQNGLDPKRRWYLQKPEALNSTWAKNGFRFSSFRTRYKKIVSLCLPSEFTAIGKSYIHAYGMSKDIHFTADDNSHNFEKAEAWRGISRVGLLCVALVVRCQISLNIVPEGINKHLREMHDSNTVPQSLIDESKAEKVMTGDFVWAWGDLAEVVESKTSTYGFRSYNIRYLNTPPISSIKEDSFASGQIKLFLTRKRAEGILDRMLSGLDFPEAERAHIISLIPKNRDEALKDVAKSAWKAHAAIKAAKNSPQAKTPSES